MFVFDFGNCKDGIKTVEVNPKGWMNPITIEYGLAQAHKYDPQLSIVWRVKDTSHTFTIYERRLNIISNGDYKKHFEEALSNFAVEYGIWISDDEYKDLGWVGEYGRDLGRFILDGYNGSESEKN